MTGMALSGKVSATAMAKLAEIGKATDVLRTGIQDAVKAGKLEGNVDDLYLKALRGKIDTNTINFPKEVSDASNYIKRANLLDKVVANSLAVSGEARQEGVNNSQQYGTQLLNQINTPEKQLELFDNTAKDLYKSNPEMFTADPNKVDPEHSIKQEYTQTLFNKFMDNKNKALHGIEDAKQRMAGVDFALNFPILYASNMIQFGKTFSRGYDSQKSFLNNLKSAALSQEDSGLSGANRIVRNNAEDITQGFNLDSKSIADKSLNALKVLKNPLAEGNEEMLQQAAQTASQNYAGATTNMDIDEKLANSNPNSSFYGYKIDPKAEQSQLSLLNSIAKGITDTYTDPTQYVQGFVGGITGLVGAPNFMLTRNQKGGINPFEGGV